MLLLVAVLLLVIQRFFAVDDDLDRNGKPKKFR